MSLVSSAFGGVKFTHPAKFKGAFNEPNAVKFELKNAVKFYLLWHFVRVW